MNQPYPIIGQSALKNAPRRGPLGLGAPRRSDGEIPTLNPHEVLVYRVGGNFIVDDGHRRLDDGRVVTATSVSVVNVRKGADVAVTFEIISQDEAKFVVQVNFVCSVIDPITVVRDGQTNASEALLAYLRGYQPLFDVGLKHPLADINAVRLEAGLHVKAYMTISPPEIPGMSIGLANVQVMTPQELGEHQERRRKEERERAYEAERLQGELRVREQQQRGEQTLRRQQTAAEQLMRHEEQRGDQTLKEQQQKDEQILARRQQESDLLTQLKQQESDHLLGRLEHQHNLEQAVETLRALGSDPRQALLLAHIRGDVSADEYARRLRAMDEDDWRREKETKEAKRLARDKAQEIALAYAKEQAAIARQDAREATSLKREDDLRILEWNRQDEREDKAYQQAKEERNAAESREHRKQEIEVELEVLREFNKRGLLDNYYPDVKDMIRRIRGEPIAASSDVQVEGAEGLPELPPGRRQWFSGRHQGRRSERRRWRLILTAHRLRRPPNRLQPNTVRRSRTWVLGDGCV